MIFLQLYDIIVLFLDVENLDKAQNKILIQKVAQGFFRHTLIYSR